VKKIGSSGGTKKKKGFPVENLYKSATLLQLKILYLQKINQLELKIPYFAAIYY